VICTRVGQGFTEKTSRKLTKTGAGFGFILQIDTQIHVAATHQTMSLLVATTKSPTRFVPNTTPNPGQGFAYSVGAPPTGIPSVRPSFMLYDDDSKLVDY